LFRRATLFTFKCYYKIILYAIVINKISNQRQNIVNLSITYSYDAIVEVVGQGGYLTSLSLVVDL